MAFARPEKDSPAKSLNKNHVRRQREAGSGRRVADVYQLHQGRRTVIEATSVKTTAVDATAQFAKRNEPMRCFVPEREPYTSKTLREGQPADIGEFGMVAKGEQQAASGKRQAASDKRHAAAEVMDMVHADVGGEPAQHGRQVVM